MRLSPLKTLGDSRDKACAVMNYIGMIFMLAGLFIAICAILFVLFPPPIPSDLPPQLANRPPAPRWHTAVTMLFTISLPFSSGVLALLCARGIRRHSRFWLAVAVSYTFLYTALFIVLGVHFFFSSKFPRQEKPILLFGMFVVAIISAQYHFTLLKLQREDRIKRSEKSER